METGAYYARPQLTSWWRGRVAEEGGDGDEEWRKGEKDGGVQREAAANNIGAGTTPI